MKTMRYESTQADPDVWIKRDVKPNVQEYYCYMLVYVDDVLHVHHNLEIDMKLLSSFYRLKDEVGSPRRYLGANIEKVELEDSREVWSMTCVEYTKDAIRNVNGMLEKDKVAMKFLVMDTYHTHHLTERRWMFHNYYQIL